MSIRYVVNIEFIYISHCCCACKPLAFDIRDLQDFPRDNSEKEIEIILIQLLESIRVLPRENDLPVFADDTACRL